MAAKFQFYLDGTLLTTEPKGWEDLTTSFKRDNTNHGLLITQDAQLEFYKDGHAYIKNIFDNVGYCAAIEIIIKQRYRGNYEKIFEGIIYISDSVFDLMRHSVKCKTVDNSFYAKIDNNKSIKAKIDVGRSKNDEAIAAATSKNIQFFDPSNGNYNVSGNGQPVKCWPVYEVFRFLISFMSDGAVDFVSDDFGAGGIWEGVTITNGENIRLMDNAATIPELSYGEIYDEINKKFNIGFAVEIIGSRPTFRIENHAYFFNSSNSLTLTEAKEVALQMDASLLYSKVHLGGSLTDDAVFLAFPEAIEFVGFKDETFHTLGQCNVDNTLELSGAYAASSNVIEQTYINNITDYDSDIFIVDTVVATNKAVQSDWLNLGKYYYNELLTNENTTQRWLDGIPNSIAHYLGNTDNRFYATRSIDTSFAAFGGSTTTDYVENPALFADDYTPPGFDANNNYGNGTIQGSPVMQADSRFTASSSGGFVVDAQMYVSISSLTGGLASPGFIQMRVFHYDSLNVLKQAFGNVIFISNAAKTYTLKLNRQLNMVGGDYAIIVFNAIAVSFPGHPNSYSGVISASSYFSVLKTATGGGIYKTVDPSNYKIKKYSFGYPLTYSNFKTLKADPKKLITFTTNNNQHGTGWIDEIKYFHHNKTASIKLITN